MSALGRLAILAALAVCATGCSVHRLDDQVAADAPDPSGVASLDLADATGSATAEPDAGDPDGGGVTVDGPAEPGAIAGDPTADATQPVANLPVTGPGSVPRTASDRGVSEDEITLGILHTSDAFFAVTGSSTKKVDRVIAPFIREINESGGINGRIVVPQISTYDPLSTDSMNAACVEQAEDHRVFAAIAQNGFYGDAEVCMAVKEVPLLTGNNSSRKTNVDRERGWVRQTHQNKDRNMVNWIDWMLRSGRLDANTTTGLLYVDVPEDRDLVEEVILPYLRAKGLPRPRLATLSSSIAQTPAEAQAAVLAFKANGVELVLPLVSFLRILIFAQQAEAADFRPTYTVSDFGLLATDAMAGMPSQQWEGVQGITVLRTGIDEPGALPTSPQFRECHDVYTQYGEEFAASGEDGTSPDPLEVVNMMHYCQHIALWADAARRAGPNPTRRGLLAAFDSTGTWSHRVTLSERLTYAPGKFDGADLYSVVQWMSGCTSDGGCYRQIERFRAGA